MAYPRIQELEKGLNPGGSSIRPDPASESKCSDARPQLKCFTFFNVVNLRSQKKRSLHGVNEYFFDERNEAGGHYGQTLINRLTVTVGQHLP